LHGFLHDSFGDFHFVKLNSGVEMIDGDGSELGDFMFHVFVVLFELIDSGMKVGNFVLGFTFVVLHEDIVRVFVEIALG
jgi:hypothetical protein